MTIQATGTFVGKSWDEKPFHELAGAPRLARASVANAFHGDVEGDGTLEYLLIYREDGSCGYIGVERVVGRIGDRSGSFVLQHEGNYAVDTATGTWFVVPGSGTGELHGLQGDGAFVGKHGEPSASYTLDYDFA